MWLARQRQGATQAGEACLGCLLDRELPRAAGGQGGLGAEKPVRFGRLSEREGRASALVGVRARLVTLQSDPRPAARLERQGMMTLPPGLGCAAPGLTSACAAGARPGAGLSGRLAKVRPTIARGGRRPALGGQVCRRARRASENLRTVTCASCPYLELEPAPTGTERVAAPRCPSPTGAGGATARSASDP